MTTTESVRKTNAARAAAIKRLINLHYQEWKELYAEEAVSRGVSPRGASTVHKIRHLQARLDELRATVDRNPDEHSDPE